MVASNESTSPKLDELRTLLSKAQDGEGVAAFIIPTEDAHMGEYPPDCDARRVFVTGFTGSAGTAVVTSDAALLWTDGRYFLQAESQLESGWTLMKHGTPGCPEIEDWLAENVPEGSAVGYDPWLHTVAAAEKLEAALTEGGRRLWAGVAAAEKLADLRRAMAALRASALLVTALDEVAWLLNLRGGDVAHNPVFISYCLVTADAATLFVDRAKLGEAAGAALREAGVGVAAYEAEMTADEIAWVDAYHAKVLAALTPRLSGRELEWLKEATLPL
ncbi:Xaa-Pro aminopeptidase 1 [Auxenochlorella protothecoides]|uniref:Xaa-Pro aminopeptidase 1 n=1 Tax=Auxenochlorella protothecoides TaxID=3075 RepID=A0A087SH27_AUXPR|nr:Xaa-Pro aminopeptidase 1 [Auxenochlorella protothecoides]KFM25031.1 Xaa-Pro aminopeptidase 1 [Auxenochlorella protothecoides]